MPSPHGRLRSAKVRNRYQTRAFDNLWSNRDTLNAYTRALLALSAHRFGDTERSLVLIRNLENGVKIDRRPDLSVIQRGAAPVNDPIATAHWGEDGLYWRWSDGGVEATAFALRAILAIDPENELIEPVMNWLVRNRRGAQWSNTRDTAITVLALNGYLKSSGELDSELEFEILVNGSSVARRRIGAGEAIAAPGRFSVDPGLIQDGVNEIRIVRRSGAGPIYFSTEARFFSLEEPVTPAGNEIFIRRQYYRWVGRPTLLNGYVLERRLLADGDTVVSGDRIEAVITIEAKNDYEYLLFEDLKPAGLEAVQVRSGEPLYARELKSAAVEQPDYSGESRWVYQELRDRKVALFLDRLPEGVWEVRYDLRAEVPGRFHALPVTGHAMYVPEIRCNGAETRLVVEDRNE